MPRTLVSMLLAAAATWAMPDPARGEPVLRHQLLVNGDFELFGNTLVHDCAAAAPDPVVGTVGACGATVNDVGPDVYWRSDPASGTADASLAVAPTDARSTAVFWIPDGATVRYARLYWAAEVAAPAYDVAAELVTPDGAVHAIAAEEGLVIPVLDPEGGPGGLQWYQSSADVTTLLQELVEPRGPYTVGGVDSLVLADQNYPTAFAAWWIVAFYEDPGEIALRQLTLFDGLDAVISGTPQSVTLAGFRVPAGFDAKLGVVAYEGDSVYNNDALLFRGYDSALEPDPTELTTLSDALNPANDFFNGTRGSLGLSATRAGDLPRMSGSARSMMGFDLDVVDLVTNGAIKAGDDSARIRATLGGAGDSYALAAFVTSINTLRPSFLRTEKTVTNLTRSDGTTFAGDLVEYVISTANTGNDPSVGTVLEDPLPPGVSFVAGSLEVAYAATTAYAGPISDARDSDTGEYGPASRKVVVRLGAGADGASGGSMAVGERAVVRFQVTVEAGASGTLLNQAVVTAGGASGEPPRTFGSTPPGGGDGATPLPVDACRDDGDCGGATPACLVAATPNVCVACATDAHCGGATPICDGSAHSCVGLSTIAPATQEKTTVAGTAAPFDMTLTSNLAGPDTYDLGVGLGCPWPMELRSAGGALLGTRDAAGTWTIAPGGDTNGDGQPDLGETAGGGTSGLVLSILPPAGVPEGSACTATVTAHGAASDHTASAEATLRTGQAATWNPDHTGASARAVSRGGTVRFPGVIQNNGSSPLSFDVSAIVTTSPDAGALAPHAIYSDPDGDGDPADGAPIAATGPVPAYGGTVHVVLVLRAATASGAPLATGTILHATATAGAAGVVAAQASEARVQFAATYTDAAHTLVRARFAPCDTVHLGGALLPGGFPYALEWYAGAAPVRGVDVPVRAVDPWPVSGGSGGDALALPASAAGTWTVLVVQKASPDVVLQAVTFEVERAGAFVTLSVPAQLGLGDDLAVSAAVRNDGVLSAFEGSQLSYLVTNDAVFMDGAGAFAATPATAHLTSAVTVGAGETASDGWVVASPAWPAPGVYRVDAEWRLRCGATPAIASATGTFEVVDAEPPAAPTFTFPGDGAALSATLAPGGALTITGTTDPDTAVTVTVDGVDYAAQVTGASWSLPLTLADGPHVAAAVAVDAAGNASPAAAIAFSVDAHAPGAPALIVASPTRADPVPVGGSAEAGSTVELFLDAASVGTTTAGAGGSFSFSLAALAEDAYELRARATDAVGNVSPLSDPLALLVDRTAPGEATVDLAPGAVFDASGAPGGVVPLSGTAEMGSAVEVELDGLFVATVVQATDGTWQAGVALPDGGHEVRLRATDAAGNVGGWSAPVLFTLDANAPAAPALDPVAAATSAAAIAVAGSAEDGATVGVWLDGAFVGTVAAAGGTFSFDVAVAEGDRTFQVTATDAVGNESAPSGFSVRVDRSTPEPVLDPLGAATTALSITVTGSAEDGATVTILLDGAFTGTTLASGGLFSLDVPVSEGLRTFTASAVDPLGNVSSPSAPVTVDIDRTAPSVPTLDALVSPSNATTVTVTGTAPGAATVTIYRDGSPVGTVVGGSFSLDVAVPEGASSFTASAEDALGNASARSGAVTVDIDRTAPAAPELGAPLDGADVASGMVAFVGTAESGSTVTVTVAGVSQAGLAGPDGAFSVSVDVPAGDWTASVTATDPAGNVSSATDRAFTATRGGGSSIGGGDAGGGCGCSEAGQASPSVLLLLALVLLCAPRRRAPAG